MISEAKVFDDRALVYLAIVLATVVVLGAKWLLIYEWGLANTHFVFSAIVITTAAVSGGVAPGILASVLLFLVCNHFFEASTHQSGWTSDGLFHSGAVLFESTLLVILGSFVHFTRRNSARSQQQAEELVSRRTADLQAEIAAHKASQHAFIQAKEAAEREREAADAANQAKSIFLANMSHEIRTPLGAVLGFAHLLGDVALPGPDRAKYIAAIERNGELLSKVISDILDISRIEAGRIEIDRREVVLRDVLSDVLSLLGLKAEAKGLQLTVVENVDVTHRFHTDEFRLKQILINIIGNAIKFTSKGSVELTVAKRLQAQGAQLIFIVKDTGAGIDGDQVRRLFQPFVQADISVRRLYGGTGLGLVLAKHLAQLLGGDVVITASEPGVGSTFTISIDAGDRVAAGAVDAEQKALTAADRKLTAVAAGARLDGCRILLVDDSEDNQVLGTKLLEMAGAVVDTAGNGMEAIQRVRSTSYDLLLMDLQMPIMDGFQATALLREQGFTLPIVALTAHTFREEQQRCLANGFTAHLGKPFNRRMLLDSVAKYAAG